MLTVGASFEIDSRTVALPGKLASDTESIGDVDKVMIEDDVLQDDILHKNTLVLVLNTTFHPDFVLIQWGPGLVGWVS